MTTVQISTTYNIDWRVKDYPNYGVTKSGIVINLQRCKILKRTVVGYSKGYYISGKFITIGKLRTMLIKDKKEYCPF